MSFTFFDIIILSIISLSTLLGFYRGMVNIIVDIIAMIAIIVLTITLSPILQPYLLLYLKNELLSLIVSYIGTYIILSLISTLILSKLSFLLAIFKIPIVNSILGGVLGVVRGGVISAVLYGIAAIITTGSYLKATNSYEMIYNIDQKKYPEWLEKAETKTFLDLGWYLMTSLVPDSYLKSLELPHSLTKTEGEIDDEFSDKKEANSSGSEIQDSPKTQENK